VEALHVEIFQAKSRVSSFLDDANDSFKKVLSSRFVLE